ncbi:carbonic anhydrase [Vararia minispora EC-137]|uniref:Carbonic anhydrase n=1 Tax=Vararia minispora EC-137 TaxID=1314806 RepID=A0ACB8QT24_9AGAM|nr:carbonic anhydrase [Vararia minispora EC-137]
MDEHLARLFTSNAAWADAVSAADPGFFAASAAGQAPKLLWIGCADSRVPESVLAAAKPGDIFTHRNIANQVHADDDSVNAVLAYAVGHVGVLHVLVVGHSNCGGAAACYAASLAPRPPPSDSLSRWLLPLTELAASLGLDAAPSAEEALATLVEENVKAQVANAAASDALTKAWAAGKNVWVHGLVYDLATGRLRDLGVSRGPGKQ